MDGLSEDVEHCLELRIAGNGGQGIVLASIILARAFALYEHKYVLQSQSYGSEARGGACRGDIIVSNEAINELRVSSPAIMLILSQTAMDRYAEMARHCKLLIVDEAIVTDVPRCDAMIHRVRATKCADELGSRLVANLVMLGYLAALGVVSEQALVKSIHDCVPERFLELNLKAMTRGLESAQMCHTSKHK